MKQLFRNQQSDDKKIEEIIHSFKEYAIRDIRVNLENPIAAFMLCSCLIDQLAGFRYNHPINKNREYYRKFIDDYLPRYNSLKLYENLRCKLVHGYSISEYLAISVEHNPLEGFSDNMFSANTVTVRQLFNDLRSAFEILCNDFENNPIVRKNALDRYTFQPPLIQVNRAVWQYSEVEADYLISHYSDLLIGKFINNEANLRIDALEKHSNEDAKFFLRCISKESSYTSYLDEVTQQYSLEYPIDVLKRVGLHKD
jgi:hypothetical protein